MKKSYLLFAVLSMFITSFLVGCGANNAAQEKAEGENSEKSNTKAALILGTGGLGDQSFNDLTFEGMNRAKKELGIEFDYVEPKAIADFELFQRDMAASGDYGVIVCVGFDQADALQKVASEFTEQKFAIIDMVVDLPNVASYLSKEEEGSFLVGAMAGLMKKEPETFNVNDKNVLGFVGAVDIPMIRGFQAGYMAGAKYVNPDIEVVDDIVGSFSDITIAKEISLVMKQKGADIIYHAAGGSGMGVFQAAQEADFLAIGVNSNQNHIAPDHIVASMLKRVDNATFKVVEQVVNDNFQTGIFTLGIKDGGVGYTLENSNVKVPESIIQQLEELEEKIKKGEIEVPKTVEEVDTFLANRQ